jgi:hypothetical protein
MPDFLRLGDRHGFHRFWLIGGGRVAALNGQVFPRSKTGGAGEHHEEEQ